MEKPFKIIFDLPLENSGHTLQLTAEVQVHHSVTYYVIDNFQFEKSRSRGGLPVLPKIEIEKVDEHGVPTWVHCDSKRSSMLSIAIGKAIEEHIK